MRTRPTTVRVDAKTVNTLDFLGSKMGLRKDKCRSTVIRLAVAELVRSLDSGEHSLAPRLADPAEVRRAFAPFGPASIPTSN